MGGWFARRIDAPGTELTYLLSRCRGQTASVLHRRGAAGGKISGRQFSEPTRWHSAGPAKSGPTSGACQHLVSLLIEWSVPPKFPVNPWYPAATGATSARPAKCNLVTTSRVLGSGNGERARRMAASESLCRTQTRPRPVFAPTGGC